jgi:hypothetical protein
MFTDGSRSIEDPARSSQEGVIPIGRKPGDPREVRASKEVPTISEEQKSAPAAQPGRQDIAESVERYLAGRGMVAGEPRDIVESVAAEVVDRFLAAQRAAGSGCGCGSAPKPPAVKAGCGCGTAPKASAPSAPTVAVAGVVCENDVRAAIRKGSKIYVGPKTVVTPSARDLAREHDVLVAVHPS